MKLNRLLILAVIPLAGCGTGVSGTYSCDDVGFVETIELTSDGKIFAAAKVYGVTQKTAGTYEIDGERVLANVDGESDVFDLKDGNLIIGDGERTRQ